MRISKIKPKMRNMKTPQKISITIIPMKLLKSYSKLIPKIVYKIKAKLKDHPLKIKKKTKKKV